MKHNCETVAARCAGARRWFVASILTCFAGVVFAADAPKETSPAPRPPIAEERAAPAYAPGFGPIIVSNPIEALTSMAASLDKHGSATAVKVDGQPITFGEIAEVIRGLPASTAALGFEALGRRALDQLVRQKLMVMAAEKEGLDKDPIVQRRQQSARDRVIAEEWLTRKSEAAVSEEDLRKRYEREVAGKPGPEEVRARVIIVPSEVEARNFIAMVQRGEEFAGLARKVSKDPSAVAGGDLGYVRFETIAPTIATAIFSLSPGQVTPFPIPHGNGFLIARVEGRRQRGTPTFEEARGDLMRESRREAAVSLLQAQLAAAQIKEIRPPGANAPPAPK